MKLFVELIGAPTGKSDVVPVDKVDSKAVMELYSAVPAIIGCRFFEGDGSIQNGGYIGKKSYVSNCYFFSDKGCKKTLEDLIEEIGPANTLVERMKTMGCEATFSVGHSHYQLNAGDEVI